MQATDQKLQLCYAIEVGEEKEIQEKGLAGWRLVGAEYTAHCFASPEARDAWVQGGNARRAVRLQLLRDLYGRQPFDRWAADQRGKGARQGGQIRRHRPLTITHQHLSKI